MHFTGCTNMVGFSKSGHIYLVILKLLSLKLKIHQLLDGICEQCDQCTDA